MIKNFISKIDSYWVFTVLTVLLCFGFFLTNPSMGIDDEILYHYNNLPINIWTDRIMQFFFGKIFRSFEYSPFFTSILTVITYTAAIALLADIFMKYTHNFNKASAILFSCIAISFPFISFIFIFNQVCLTISLGILISAFSVLLFCKYIFENKSVKYIIYIVLLELCAWSLFQILLFYFIVCSLFVLYSKALSENNSEEEKEKFYYLKYFSILFIISFAVIFIDYAIVKILSNIYHIPNIRFDNLTNKDFSSITGLFVSYYNSIKEFLSVFFKHIIPFNEGYSCNIACTVTFICYIIFFLYNLIFSVKNKKPFSFLCGITMLLVPFGVLIITGEAHVLYRAYVTAGIINAITIVLLYNLFSNNSKIKYIVILLTGIIVFFQALEINQIFYTENIKVKNDEIFARNLMYDIQKNYTDNKPLVIIGTRENAELKYTYYNVADEINVSTFNWDRYDSAYGEIRTIRPYAFIRAQGFPVKGFFENTDNLSDNDIKNYMEIIEKEAADMNNYPSNNSIKDLDEFILIKIGESRFKELNDGKTFEGKSSIDKSIFDYR